ncbi:MAG: Nif11-like leader peptide family natural product precursor [Microcystaceae cyanobacterium]
MARENVIKLFREVQKNPSLREQLNQAANLNRLVTIAQELGYDFTIEEWQELTAFKVEEYQCEISEIPGI